MSPCFMFSISKIVEEMVKIALLYKSLRTRQKTGQYFHKRENRKHFPKPNRP